MNSTSVSLSRPYYVNAPLIEDANSSNQKTVELNNNLCRTLLQRIDKYIPYMYKKNQSLSSYKGGIGLSCSGVDWPLYLQIVRYHVDIPLIQEKLDKHLYYCDQDMVDDIELLWFNCINYFATNKEEYRCDMALN